VAALAASTKAEGPVPVGASATRRPTSVPALGHAVGRADSASAMPWTTAPLARRSVAARFGRARIGRWVPVASCPAALASADAAALAGVALDRASRDRVASALVDREVAVFPLVGPAREELGPARHALAPGRAPVAARVTTTAVPPGGTATREIVGRRHDVTAMRVTAARRRGAHRSARGATRVTRMRPRRVGRDRLAICCTGGTPSWRRCGPADRSAA
jgi:hypothetical protein